MKQLLLFLFKHTLFRCYVAGETEKEALAMARLLHGRGFGVIFDILGEEVTVRDDARRVTTRYLRLIDSIVEFRSSCPGLRAAVSVKPSSLGIKFGPVLAEQFLKSIAGHAAFYRIGFEVDMEGPETMAATMDMLEKAMRSPLMRADASQGYAPRLALPANQIQSFRLLERAAKTGLKIRIVKGAYPGDLTHQDDINAAFFTLAWSAVVMYRVNDVAIGTHDENLVEKILPYYPRTALQCLYGVRMFYQEQLVREGRKASVYLPLGGVKDAFNYLMRRWKEGIRPKTAFLFLLNIFESLRWRRHNIPR